MTNPSLQRGLNLGLAALCLLAVVLVALELGKWPFLGSPPQAERKASSQAGASKAPLKSKKAGNPFARTPPASALPVTSSDTGITVYGVIIDPEGSMVLAKAGGGGIKLFKPGQSLGGFRIKEVQADRLILQKGDKGPSKTIRWLKRGDYLSQPRPPSAPPQTPKAEPRREPPPPGFRIKPGPQEKLKGTNP